MKQKDQSYTEKFCIEMDKAITMNKEVCFISRKPQH